MTTSFARVRRSTGTVIGPAGGGAAFAAASEGETMKWLRPRPAARLTTATTAMIQIVRVEPVMALMVGVPSGSSARSRGVLRPSLHPCVELVAMGVHKFLLRRVADPGHDVVDAVPVDGGQGGLL